MNRVRPRAAFPQVFDVSNASRAPVSETIFFVRVVEKTFFFSSKCTTSGHVGFPLAAVDCTIIIIGLQRCYPYKNNLKKKKN